jgi:uncharacterized protein (TIGR02246 family)
MDSDEQAIRDFVVEWMRASRAGEHEKVLGMIAEDVVFLTAGRPPMRGRAAFAEAQRGMAGFEIDGEADVQEVKVFGDWAFLWTNLTVTVTPPGGSPVKRSGNTLTIMRKIDGRWVIARDANMLAPVAE